VIAPLIAPVIALSLALSWVQVQSDSFVVKSSVGEARARRVLSELESFRELIGTTIAFKKVQLPELPVEVLLIGDEDQFRDLSPEYNGKKVKVSGYYERGQDRDFIVLSAAATGNLTHVVYHELTHYFLTRSLEPRPAWLNEGLAEYFATAEIDDDTIYLGGLSQLRVNLLKTHRLLPLKDFLSVDDQSPYYNELEKANVFYAQAWAFVHFLTHGPYKDDFGRYLEALGHKEVSFSDYVKADLRTLEIEFGNYLRLGIRAAQRDRVKIQPDGWTMSMKPIAHADVDLSITEIFLSAGNVDKARQYLDRVVGMDDEFPRASYYRGVLARIKGGNDAREYFIDALLDLNLGPRAAVHLVQLRELQIPAARRALELAAANGTHMADVYWALSEIYLDDARRAQELMRLSQAKPAIAPNPPPVNAVEPEPTYIPYTSVDAGHFKYEFLSVSGAGPRTQTIVPPYFPPELLNERLAGKVIVDVQVSETGEVGGLWLISSSPEVFSALATAAVRDWKFEPVATKIRIVVHFIP
jgi:TonB family protein